MSHPLFEVVTTTAGAVSIRNKEVNEIMHNPVGPWAEANALYIDQSGLRERLRVAGERGEEFVLWDVGLGAAANALAVLACQAGLGASSGRLRLVSFERDMELLRFALQHASEFPHFQGYEEALEAILQTGAWQTERLDWRLYEGDFLEQITNASAKPHMIYFDPYSPKVNQDMWGLACFRKIRAAARSPEEGGTLLFTYSQATRIRAAFIAAGFFVGAGDATGLKEETTQVSTDLKLLRQPLAHKWYLRWTRSHVRYPFDCTGAHEEAAVDQILAEYMQRNFSPA